MRAEDWYMTSRCEREDEDPAGWCGGQVSKWWCLQMWTHHFRWCPSRRPALLDSVPAAVGDGVTELEMLVTNYVDLFVGQPTAYWSSQRTRQPLPPSRTGRQRRHGTMGTLVVRTLTMSQKRTPRQRQHCLECLEAWDESVCAASMFTNLNTGDEHDLEPGTW